MSVTNVFFFNEVLYEHCQHCSPGCAEEMVRGHLVKCPWGDCSGSRPTE